MKTASFLMTGFLLLAGSSGCRPKPRPAQAPLAAAATLEEAARHPERPAGSAPILEALRSDLAVHRQLVLFSEDLPRLKGPARETAIGNGHRLHHERTALAHQLNAALQTLAAEPPPQRDPVVSAALNWIERDPEILELDRLAFRDPLRILQRALATDASAEGRVLGTRLAKDLSEVDRVEALLEAEYRQAKGGERKLWRAYVDELRRLYPEAPAKAPEAPSTRLEGTRELNGRELPDKVLVLSFDDGPHHIYTEEIKAILDRYRVPAVFFEVGRNLGSAEQGAPPKLAPLSKLTEELVKAGFVVGNHSYTHAQLSKETGAPLDLEIGETDRLLQAIPGAHSHLFRFPYGARTETQLHALEPYHLRSVLWNIDSLDWADPVPASVADRVLRGVAEERRGIILFHDIHDRAEKVLPGLLERLRAEGYRFAGLDQDGGLVLPESHGGPPPRPMP